MHCSVCDVSVVCETKITYLLADITGYFNEKSFPAVNNAGTENQTQQPTKRKTNKQKLNVTINQATVHMYKRKLKHFLFSLSFPGH